MAAVAEVVLLMALLIFPQHLGGVLLMEGHRALIPLLPPLEAMAAMVVLVLSSLNILTRLPLLHKEIYNGNFLQPLRQS